MHAFKNALIPVLTLAGVNLVVMVNAAVIIEVIFAWPGIGRLLYEGIFQRDFPLVQGVVIGRDHDRADQPDRRHPLRLHRSAHPAHQVGAHGPSPTHHDRRCRPGIERCELGPRCRRLARELPLLPLAILVPFVLIARIRQRHRALRSDRADPGREDLRAAVLDGRAAARTRCSAPTSRAATS